MRDFADEMTSYGPTFGELSLREAILNLTLENHGFDVKPISLDSSSLNVKDLSLTNAKATYVTPSQVNTKTTVSNSQ